jgi:hypothetical protein
MTGWNALDAELDLWRRDGRQARLWLRDDDAVGPTATLDRLLTVTGTLPLALAVIPQACAAMPLPDRVAILQHGWSHRDHAPAGQKKQELGHRPVADCARELAQGRARLQQCFASQALPVLVPPWNRIDPALLPELPRLGFAGLSTMGVEPPAAAGLRQVNTHVDLIRWRPVRAFAGEETVLAAITDGLTRRRTGGMPATAPLGLLTHHLVHDKDLWRFLARLLDRLGGHPAVLWPSIDAIFRP